MLELLLRLLNYGGSLDLFVPGPGKLEHHYIANPEVGRRYFAALKQRPIPPNDYFARLKPANGYRVFVLGGSTTNGYPYGSNLMFSRILEAQLQDVLPDRAVEVINVSMTAINSYTLLDFMEDILEQHPDAILMYAGHNEYYGALGAASMIKAGSNRAIILAYLQLSRLKTFILVRDIFTRITTFSRQESLPPTATLMERIVANQSIPLNSPLYVAGREQFAKNVRAILKKAKKARVPMLLSELVCNTCGLAPFVSIEGAESAENVFDAAVRLQENQHYDSARVLFKKARDLDALRFRAPAEFNQIIHQVAAEYGAPVVPMESVFETASPHGLVGDNLMLDHLHPTITGYFLMADAFFAEMVQAGLLPHVAGRSSTADKLRQSWGYTRLDSLYGDLGIRVLKGGWPFTPRSETNTALDDVTPQDFVEEIAKKVATYDDVSIREGHEILAKYFTDQGQESKAFQEYKALVALKTTSALPYLKVSEMLIKADDVARVPVLIAESLIFDESPLSHILLGEAYNRLERYQEAIAAFQRAQQLGAAETDPHIVVGLRYAYNALGQFAKEKEIWDRQGDVGQSADAAPSRAQAAQLVQRAEQLIEQQQFEQAMVELQKSLKIQETGQAHMLLGQIYLQKRQAEAGVEHLEKARLHLPNDPLLLYNLCIAYVQQRDYNSAWKILKALERLDPHFADPYDLKTKLAGIVNE